MYVLITFVLNAPNVNIMSIIASSILWGDAACAHLCGIVVDANGYSYVLHH